jgi:hypothetical protein
MRIAGVKAVVAVLVLLSAGVCAAQSLGDIARQDRERREALSRHSPVITNADLQKEKILPPRAQAVPAVAAQPALPQVAPDVPLWQVANQPGFSLGEYARTLREVKAARQRAVEWAEKNGIAPPPASPVPPSSAAAEILHLSADSGSLKETSAAAPPRPVRDRTPIERAPAPYRQPSRVAVAPSSDPGRPLLRVARGDSLWKLARRHWGEGSLWKVLWQSNPELRNPNLIYPGQLLRLPSDAAVAQYRARRPAARRVIARMWNTAGRSLRSHGGARATAHAAPSTVAGAAMLPAGDRIQSGSGVRSEAASQAARAQSLRR